MDHARHAAPSFDNSSRGVSSAAGPSRTQDCVGDSDACHSAAAGINWFTAIILALFHAGAVAALFMFSWRNLAVAAVFYYVATGLGIDPGEALRIVEAALAGGHPART